MANSDSEQITFPAAAPLTGALIDTSSKANSVNVDDSTNTETAAVSSDPDTDMTDLPPTAPEGSSASQAATATTSATSATTTNNQAGKGKAEPLEPVRFKADGDFELLFPATDQWGILYLRIDHAAGKLWGRFKIDNMDGAIRVDDIEALDYGFPVTFTWRYIDKEAGVIKFGPTRTGSLQGVNWTLDQPGGITGKFLGLVADDETLEFEGVNTGASGRRFADLAAFWRNIAQKAFLQS